MAIAGTVDLLTFGFDSQGLLPPELVRELEQLRGRGVIRILDMLFVSKNMEGIFQADWVRAELDVPSARAASTLWHLLVGDDPEPQFLPAPLSHQYTSWEIGLDLDAAEGLARLIEPGTSALLMLVEPRWATDLLDAVSRSGGFPLVFGCLERETMLVIGPKLAFAADVAKASERTAAVRGAAILETLASAQPVSMTATEVIPALVDARLLNDSDVDEAVRALVAAGLLPGSLLARAREHADAAVAEIAQTGIRGDPPLESATSDDVDPGPLAG